MKLLLCIVGLGLVAMVHGRYSNGPHGDAAVHTVHNKQPRDPVPGEDQAFWNQLGQAELQKQLQVVNRVQQAKNIIFFLGDGMSFSTVTAARILKGSQTGNWEHETMSWEDFPTVALAKVYNTDGQVPDSASSTTALLSGVKANTFTTGVDSNVREGNCSAQLDTSFHAHSIVQWFQDAGKSTGFVTNARVTHGTPAGAYAHIARRFWENDVNIYLEGQDPDVCDDIIYRVIMGGGRENLPNTLLDVEDGVAGRRNDDKDLITTWQTDKETQGASASYVWNRDDLLAVDTTNTEYLMGLFAFSHMDYVLDRDPAQDPSLPEMTRVAIEMLQKDGNGYFLLVEGGLIDDASHSNLGRQALTETLEFDEAVKMALDMINLDETLILVTAEHGQPLSINGNPPRQNDIMGIDDVSDTDFLPVTTLLWANGPGYQAGGRPDLSQVDTTDKAFQQSSAVPHVSSLHSGEEAGIWATGPHAHLFSGVYEQNYVAHALSYAACVGDGLTFCQTQEEN